MKRSEFRQAFIANTKNARLRAGYNDVAEFAKLLGVPLANYYKYETRTPLPHNYIPLFCKLTGISIKSMFDVGPKKTRHQEAA